MKLKFHGFPHADFYKGAGVHVLKDEVCEVTEKQGERLLKTYPKAFKPAPKNAKVDKRAPQKEFDAEATIAVVPVEKSDEKSDEKAEA